MAIYLLAYGVRNRAFFICNTIFWVLGLGSLVIGLWSYITKRDYVDLIPSSYGTLSAVGLCIAAGLTVIIITFVGCLGIWIESRLLLLAYTFFVLLLVMVQVVVSVLALNYQSDIYRRVRKDMEQSLLHTKYRQEVFWSSRLTWDELQSVFHCCGVSGPADWFGNQKWPNSSYVPDSCCNKTYFISNTSMENCGKGRENWKLWYQEGCGEVYADWLFEEIKVAAYIALIFICIEVFLLVLALLIFRSIRKNRMSYNCAHTPYHYTKGVTDVCQKKLADSIPIDE